jgi:type I restriction enzyme S subunit
MVTDSLIRAHDKKTPSFKYTTVSLTEIVEKNYRMEASVFGIEGRQARRDLERCKYPVVNLCGTDGLATAYHRSRFKRIYVEKSDFPIYQPSQINEIYPKPSAYISDLTPTDIDALRVRKGQVLLTCSGTIGNCTYVGKTLDNLIFSHDLIRIEAKKYGGFIYTYLKSKNGRSIINTNNYGAVVSHIEPEHLNNIPIPNPPAILKKKIHNLIDKSFRLRDESNELMDESQALLKNAFQLPDIEILKAQAKQFDNKSELLNYSVSISELNNRFDGSYHVPIVKVIEEHLKKQAQEVTAIGDSRISQCVKLPSHFKRIYVQQGGGTILIGGKNLYSLDPSDKKYLAPSQYSEKLRKNMLISENTIIISAKGSPGKVVISPKHWNGWLISSNLIKIVPSSNDLAGYLYCFLSSPYGDALLKRQVYGAVVDIFEPVHINDVMFPFCQDSDIQIQINSNVLNANKKRTEAYELEQEALKILNDKVIYAQ